MAIERRNFRDLSLEEYYRRLVAHDCRANSHNYYPRDPRFLEYTCCAGEFLNAETYPCGSQRRYSEHRKDPSILEEALRGFVPEPGAIEDTHLIVQHCSGCDRRIVIDGTHRLAYIATHLGDHGEQEITVTELSGSDWKNTRTHVMLAGQICLKEIPEDYSEGDLRNHNPDMHGVCVCYRSA